MPFVKADIVVEYGPVKIGAASPGEERLSLPFRTTEPDDKRLLQTMRMMAEIGCSGLASPPDKAITGAGNGEPWTMMRRAEPLLQNQLSLPWLSYGACRRELTERFSAVRLLRWEPQLPVRTVRLMPVSSVPPIP